MKTMIHNLSKRTKSALAVLLAFVMVFGTVAVIAPVEAQALSINASDSGFYNVAYGTDGKTTFGNGTQIHVINQTREGKNKSDAVYTLGTDGKWAANKKLVWDGTGENTIYGVYPYNAAYDTFTIPTDQSGGVQDADWMTATYTGAKTNSVDLKFEHRLAKVTINIKEWNYEFDGSAKVIENPKIYTKGTAVEVAYATDVPNVCTSDGTLTAITPLTDGQTYTAIVAPVKYAVGNEFMTFTVDGQALTVLAKADELTNGLQPGYHYTFDLTVGKDTIELTSVNVTDWISQDVPGGVATEVCQHINIASGICTNCGTKFFDYDETTNTAKVSTAEGLLAWNKEACAELSTNLVLVDDITLAGENNWIPVGYFDTTEEKSYPYTGTIDGGGYTITGLHINGTAWTQAFVGALGENGSIKNLTFANAQVTGANWSGIVTGTNDGTIENCHVTSGSLTSTDGSSGVFAGYNTGTVNGCTNSATVALAEGSEKSYMGGIVGRNISSGTIIGCINTGAVSGYRSVGGVAGYNDRGTVVACGNTGTVTYTDKYAGGIVGYTHGSSIEYARIIGCWTADTKNGIGYEGEYLIVSECYSGDAATINDKVSDMNTAIGNTYGYNWQAETDGYPTLLATE